jgi:proteasome lid subunit RPN8/RPN11
MTTTISRAAMHDVRRHCREAYPDECCGVIVGLPGNATRVIRVRNIQDEMHEKDPVAYPRTARTAYTGHPSDLRAALDLAEDEGCRLVAFYHSHPDHDAYFSAEDTVQATPFGEPSYPEALQLVLSVRGRSVRETKAFAWSEAVGAYVETELHEGEDA